MTHTSGAYQALVSTHPSLLTRPYVLVPSGLILGDVCGSLGFPENAKFSFGWLIMICTGQPID
jgi:hypothetical protein